MCQSGRSAALAAVEPVRAGVQARELLRVGTAAGGDELGDDRLHLVPGAGPPWRWGAERWNSQAPSAVGPSIR